VLRILQATPELSKTKDRFLKLKATKFCILDGSLYWKDLGGRRGKTLYSLMVLCIGRRGKTYYQRIS
jgi:hypothetical protein